MASAADLMGAGLPGLAATLIGLTPVTLVTTGTSAGTAAAINANFVKLDTASSQTGAILPAAAGPGAFFVVFNPDSDSGVVYPPSGATINGGSSLTVAQNKTAIFFKFSTTLWCSVLTA